MEPRGGGGRPGPAAAAAAGVRGAAGRRRRRSGPGCGVSAQRPGSPGAPCARALEGPPLRAMAPGVPEGLLGPAALLVLVSCQLCPARANRPSSPVNVTVTQLKADSATVSWDVPEGEAVIGYAISQQRQDGQVQRFIREVNTTATRSCVLWDLAEDADYVVQVQSIGLQGESAPSRRVHFRTLRRSDRLPSNSSSLQGDITMEGLDADRPLQTGEIVIIVAVLLMWAAVIALFCKQYDIIKDNDSNNNKEKTKPSSEHSTPERPPGGLLRSKKKSPSVNIIEV